MSNFPTRRSASASKGPSSTRRPSSTFVLWPCIDMNCRHPTDMLEQLVELKPSTRYRGRDLSHRLKDTDQPEQRKLLDSSFRLNHDVFRHIRIGPAMKRCLETGAR